MDSLIKVFTSPTPYRPSKLTIIAIFRNESGALREWLEHYRFFGADNFCLIDNNSSDDYRSVIESYRYTGQVSLFSCKRDGYQVGAYMELLPELREKAEWIGVFDLDEFAYPPRQSSFISVLGEFDDTATVLVPWLSFGSNGHVEQPPSIIRGFTRRGDAGCSRAFLKAFSRPKFVDLLSQHNPTLCKGIKRLSNRAIFDDRWYIDLQEKDLTEFKILNNHYRLQSKRHFETVKAERPEVNEFAQDRVKSRRFFDEYDDVWSRIEDRQLADYVITHQSGA